MGKKLELVNQLKIAFSEQFGDGEGVSVFFAPGRVNLIGEHTDYNGGHVFPCALDIGTAAVVRKRTDRTLRLYSTNFPEIGIREIDLDQLAYIKENDWANYPIGVADVLQKQGHELAHGFDIAYAGNIPNGAGLSSSASIEMVTAVFLNDLLDLQLDMVELVKFSQKAENEFIGVNSGIMDQFAIGMGKESKAILLDCNTLKYEYSPLELEEHILIIANTNKRRGLADSKYNERRAECEHALSQLQEVVDIASLGQLTAETFEQHKYVITNEIERKRAKHAVLENIRTIKAVKLLHAGDLTSFGELMNQSHISLRDDYEVTGKELDALVEAAWEAGATGARMTGAGFGGCTINLVKRADQQAFIEQVGKAYTEATGLVADFYAVNVGDGARRLS